MRFKTERTAIRVLQDAIDFLEVRETRMIRDVIPALLLELREGLAAVEYETYNLGQRLMMLKKAQRHLLKARDLADERRTGKKYISMEDSMDLLKVRHFCLAGALFIGIGMTDLRDGVQYPPQAA